jgi:hypothetical protein
MSPGIYPKMYLVMMTPESRFLWFSGATRRGRSCSSVDFAFLLLCNNRIHPLPCVWCGFVHLQDVQKFPRNPAWYCLERQCNHQCLNRQVITGLFARQVLEEPEVPHQDAREEQEHLGGGGGWQPVHREWNDGCALLGGQGEDTLKD